MANVAMTLKLNASAETVWGKIGRFGALHDWHPVIEKSELEGAGVGATRNLFLAGGGNVIERLDAEDAAGKSYTYTILDSPLPVANYQSTLKVLDNGDGSCTVDWSSNFDPSGAPEADAVAAIQGVYQAGFDALKADFGG